MQKNLPVQKNHNYLPSIMQEIALQKSFVENCLETSVSTDIPVSVVLIKETDKKQAINEVI